MINENELRIGNYYNHNSEWNTSGYNGPFKLELCDLGHITECRLSIENISGIALTEEILLKCGFSKEISKGYSSNTIWFYLPDFPLRKAGGFANPMHYSLGNYEGIKVYTLHQLQNVYFAITGKELDLKI